MIDRYFNSVITCSSPWPPKFFNKGGAELLDCPFFCPFRPIFTWEEEPNLNIVPAESPETTGNEQKVQLATHEGPRDDGKDTTEVKEYPFSKSSEAGKEVQEGENKEATKGSEAEVKEREEIKKNNDAEEKAEQDRNTAKENSDNGTNKQNDEKVKAIENAFLGPHGHWTRTLTGWRSFLRNGTCLVMMVSRRNHRKNQMWRGLRIGRAPWNL